MTSGSPITVLHLAPHPDDESIGAPATLLALREAGHRVINLACGLGRPAQQERRRTEVAEACRRAGFELVVHDPPLAISRTDDLAHAERLLTGTVSRMIDGEGVDLVVSPSPHDGHHGHELVGRAARDAVGAARRAPRWWMWGLWADLPLPTLYTGFDDARLAQVLHVLAAHQGELVRNDYPALIRARGVANRILGCERVFGFGSPRRAEPYAELLTEAMRAGGDWMAGTPRALDPAIPLVAGAGELPIGWWLRESSVASRTQKARASAPR